MLVSSLKSPRNFSTIYICSFATNYFEFKHAQDATRLLLGESPCERSLKPRRQRHPGATRGESTLGVSPSLSTYYSRSLLLLSTSGESIFRSNIDSAIVCVSSLSASERRRARARARESPCRAVRRRCSFKKRSVLRVRERVRARGRHTENRRECGTSVSEDGRVARCCESHRERANSSVSSLRGD